MIMMIINATQSNLATWVLSRDRAISYSSFLPSINEKDLEEKRTWILSPGPAEATKLGGQSFGISGGPLRSLLPTTAPHLI